MSNHQDTQAHGDADVSPPGLSIPDRNTSPGQELNPQAGSSSPATWSIIRPIGPLPHNQTLNSTLFGPAAQYPVRQAMLRNDFQQVLEQEGLANQNQKNDVPSPAAFESAFPYKERSKQKAHSTSLSESSRRHCSETSHTDDLDGSGGRWHYVKIRHEKNN